MSLPISVPVLDPSIHGTLCAGWGHSCLRALALGAPSVRSPFPEIYVALSRLLRVSLNMSPFLRVLSEALQYHGISTHCREPRTTRPVPIWRCILFIWPFTSLGHGAASREISLFGNCLRCLSLSSNPHPYLPASVPNILWACRSCERWGVICKQSHRRGANRGPTASLAADGWLRHFADLCRYGVATFSLYLTGCLFSQVFVSLCYCKF